MISAQQDRGTFVGTVTDATGAVVPNAKIAITNTETNVTVNTVTTDAGNYRMPNLAPGAYRVKVEVSGFKTGVRDGLRLAVQDVARVDIALEVGQTTESVTVTGEAPMLTTDTPEVGTLMSNQTVIDMPLGFSGGRYAENFAYKLTPGVGGDNWESHINGAPSFSKEVVLDGASATIYISGHMGESSPSMEALEEFKIQTSGMSAEFTRTAGGVFNFVMKSGTNQFHGSGMYQWHNESFDANTFANNFYGNPRRPRTGGTTGRCRWADQYGSRKSSTGRTGGSSTRRTRSTTRASAGGGSPTRTVPQPEWYDGQPEQLSDEREARSGRARTGRVPRRDLRSSDDATGGQQGGAGHVPGQHHSFGQDLARCRRTWRRS